MDRRGVLKVSGAALFGAAFPLAGCAGEPTAQMWSGDVLGAPASINIRFDDDEKSGALFKAAEKEIARLAQIFSLYNPDSEISRLNRDGGLTGASPEMIEVLEAAQDISDTTGGAFDCTIQPLWNLALYMERIEITKAGADELWANARALVDYKGVLVNGRRVSFAKPGMAITLNGVVQGYITDKVTALLQAGGVKHGLVNIGEYRAFGKAAGGESWRVGIQDPNNVIGTATAINLDNSGLATSAAGGGQVTEQISHIFDARRGRKIGSKPAFASASVTAPTAMQADGLATAFTLMDEASIRDICAAHDGISAYLIKHDGYFIQI